MSRLLGGTVILSVAEGTVLLRVVGGTVILRVVEGTVILSVVEGCQRRHGSTPLTMTPLTHNNSTKP